MSSHLKLVVKKIIKETADAVTLVFDKPEGFTYKSGQFLTFIMNIKGSEVRRSYSLCSSPVYDEYIAVSVKKIEGGLMSPILVEQVKEGDTIESLHPTGAFTYTNEVYQQIVCTAAGSGITPILSIIKTALKQNPSLKLLLIYGNRNENSVILGDQIKELEQNFADRFTSKIIYSKPQSSYPVIGRLHKYSIKGIVEDVIGSGNKPDVVYTCGPDEMMTHTFEAMRELGVLDENLRKESFNTQQTVDVHEDIPEGHGTYKVKITYDGETHDVIVNDGQTILEAALDVDIDLPYSCQSGMCTACMGKCNSGEVHMTNPEGLSKNEIAKGFVLTCVSKPVGSGVHIEID